MTSLDFQSQLHGPVFHDGQLLPCVKRVTAESLVALTGVSVLRNRHLRFVVVAVAAHSLPVFLSSSASVFGSSFALFYLSFFFFLFNLYTYLLLPCFHSFPSS
jgi:hypothetical protein